jgi:hypothetical protein
MVALTVEAEQQRIAVGVVVIDWSLGLLDLTKSIFAVKGM